MPNWYAITNKSDAEAEVSIYNDIGGFGIPASQFVDDIRPIKAKTLHVRMNTRGGDVFDGTAIYNALKNHPARVVVHIDGLAASAGSFIAMAGDEVRIADNAYMMIHNARGGAMGGKNTMRSVADSLEGIDDNIAGMYAKKTGKPKEYWASLMDAETWFTAKQAKDAGLVDIVEAEGGAKITAAFDLSIFNKVPNEVIGAFGSNPTTENQSPGASSRDDIAPAQPQQEKPQMADSTTITPATAPAAGQIEQPKPGKTELQSLREQEIQGYVSQGHQAGITEGRKTEQARCRAIMDACPGKPLMALNAFISGQSPEAVKLAFEAASAAEAAAEARIAELQEENARRVALAAAGGYSGGIPMTVNQSFEEPSGPMTREEAKATAEREWDRNPSARKGFSSRDNFVSIRTAELRGQFNGRSVG